MSALLSFSGVDYPPVLGKPADQKRVLQAAGKLMGSLTVRQGYALIALLCRGTSADIERTLVRLAVLLRAFDRRDILSLLYPDGVSNALDIAAKAPVDEVSALYTSLTSVDLTEEVQEENRLLDCLEEGDPHMQLITHFQAGLALRLKRLFITHQNRAVSAALKKVSKRCRVEAGGYDDTRYKPRHWQKVLMSFAQQGVYPPEFLKEKARIGNSIPWPESCRALLTAYTPAPLPEAPSIRGVSALLTELVEGVLRPADVARLALTASRYVPGVYVPRQLWFELAWSLLDSRQRTSGLEGDLTMFKTCKASAVPKAVDMS